MILEPDKIEEIGWFSLDNLPEPLTMTAKEAIECFRNKTLISKR